MAYGDLTSRGDRRSGAPPAHRGAPSRGWLMEQPPFRLSYPPPLCKLPHAQQTVVVCGDCTTQPLENSTQRDPLRVYCALHNQLDLYIRLSVCLCVCVRLCTCISVCARVPAWVGPHIRARVCLRMCRPVCTCICMCGCARARVWCHCICAGGGWGGVADTRMPPLHPRHTPCLRTSPLLQSMVTCQMCNPVHHLAETLHRRPCCRPCSTSCLTSKKRSCLRI